MKSKTKIINLFGGPGIGKSTIAARVFSELKERHVSCELVTELAKDITWEETHKLLDNQLWLYSEQFRRQFRLLDKVDFVITDSPLLMYCVYLDKLHARLPDTLKFSGRHLQRTKSFFKSSFDEFNNINISLVRAFEYTSLGICIYDYQEDGRIHQLNEALELDKEIGDLLTSHTNVDFIYCMTCATKTPHPITEYILNV